MAKFAFKFEQKFTSKFKQLRLDGKSGREICENLDNEAQAAKFELKFKRVKSAEFKPDFALG